jgi:hypothetical protein
LVDRPGGGALSLLGSVVDASGAPVSEVSVTAEFELGPGVRSLDTQPGIDLAAVVVAVTSADGAFVLRGLDRGRYRLRVEGDGIVTAEVRFVDVPGEGVRVVVARQVAVHGRVMAESVPARGVEVRLVGDLGSGTLETTTDENGQFAFEGLSEGVFRVWAYIGDQAAPAARVDRLGPGPFEDVALALGPAFIVKGRVVDLESGRGVAAYVVARRGH